MEFITVEQFREQPKEIQKVFLDWWKPSIGDLATGRYEKIAVISSKRDIDAVKVYKGEQYAMPLFTEGQLRKFIEDKTECRINITFYPHDGYDIEITKPHYTDGYCLTEKTFENLSEDLLQAYWKVACMIAKESLNG